MHGIIGGLRFVFRLAAQTRSEDEREGRQGSHSLSLLGSYGREGVDARGSQSALGMAAASCPLLEYDVPLPESRGFLDRVAVGVQEFELAQVQLADLRLDLGAVADYDPDHLVGMQGGVGGVGDIGGT